MDNVLYMAAGYVVYVNSAGRICVLEGNECDGGLITIY